MLTSSSSGRGGGGRAAPDIRRVLILGHSGFIGSRLEKIFRAESPRIEVVGLSVETHESAVDLTIPDCEKRLSAHLDSQTAVIMCSAIKRQMGDTLENFLQNMAMVSNTARLLQNTPVGRFLYFSSTAVYGEDIHNPNITEETAVHPTSYYGISKFTAECLLRKAFEKQKFSSLLILRPATVYGPGEDGYAYSPSGFIKSLLDRRPITFWGDGEEKREFVYIGDLVKLVHRLTFHSHAGVLNIVNGKSHTFRQVLDIASRMVPGEKTIDSKPRSKNKVDNGFLNVSLMRLVPDFSFTPLEDGMRQTFEHLSSNRPPDP